MLCAATAANGISGHHLLLESHQLLQLLLLAHEHVIMNVCLVVVHQAHRLLIHRHTVAFSALRDSVMLDVVYILNA